MMFGLLALFCGKSQLVVLILIMIMFDTTRTFEIKDYFIWMHFIKERHVKILFFLEFNLCRIGEFTNISEKIWKLMKQCWNMKASERPTFESIPSYLSDIRNDIVKFS
jgi:hypothetical protein